MIGNDIVDLKLARKQTHPAESRWINKVFTEDEIEVINKSEDPFLTKWLLWAMKEAVYKATTRENFQHFVAPHDLRCGFDDASLHNPIVTYKGNVFPITFHNNNEYVYTSITNIYKSPRIENVITVSGTDYVTQRKSVRTALFTHYHEKYNTPEEHLKIIKNQNGVPCLKDSLKNLIFPISLAHHGHYAAYVLDAE